MPQLPVPDALRGFASNARLDNDPETGRVHVSGITSVRNGFDSFLADELRDWKESRSENGGLTMNPHLDR